ncbi:MAG: hypothetical protein K2X93_27725, partial [Candidatus Obscuribacterales bacterium]|nr:hypothetical protein [Candidatus Obscuribacterales bacterium]
MMTDSISLETIMLPAYHSSEKTSFLTGRSFWEESYDFEASNMTDIVEQVSTSIKGTGVFNRYSIAWISKVADSLVNGGLGDWIRVFVEMLDLGVGDSNYGVMLLTPQEIAGEVNTNVDAQGHPPGTF